jgi:hypothetical protein
MYYSALDLHLQQYWCENNKIFHKIFNTGYPGLRLLPFLQGIQRDFHDQQGMNLRVPHNGNEP